MKSQGLTDFQRSCEAALSSALMAKGLALTDRALAGKKETYITAKVSPDITVYIYEDEAQFHRAGTLAGLYEHQDFAGPEQLQEAFVGGVLEAAHGS